MKKKIFIVGSGWATKGFLDTIDYNLYEVHILSNNDHFVYQPFLASSILNNEHVSFKLTDKYPLITYKKTNVSDFDFKNNKIITEYKDNYNYDYLILCHGSIVNDFNIPGIKENSYILKNNLDAEKIKHIIEKLPNDAHIAIMGCGLTGSEIVGHLIDSKKYNIYAIDGLNKPLNIFNDKLRSYTLNLWNKNNIHLFFGSFVKNIDESNIYLGNNKKINYDLAIWCGGVKIHPLSTLINKKLDINNRFGIPVNKYLKIDKLDNVWAAGDCAYSGSSPNAQVAYQHGKYLGYTFNNKFKNKNEFQFQNKGQVCYIGNNEAVYQIGDYGIGGIFGYGMMKLIKLYTKFL